MTDRPRSAPMPAALRAGRPPRHPALTIRCPHCTAAPDTRCTTRAGRTRVQRLDPCPARLDTWAVTTACCPACQTAPGTPCRTPDGRPADIHPARYTEAKAMAA
ncbi:zinc finger domain-containing protein [Streptomyces sp. NPDC054840]